MFLDPATWLFKLMQLTKMPVAFRMLLIMISLLGFALAMLGESKVFPALIKRIGDLKNAMGPRYRKKRKLYKVIDESMRI
jgi:cation-transporting ATPase 13A2